MAKERITEENIFVALVLAISLPAPWHARIFGIEADCKLLFERSDANNDQWLRGPEAKKYLRAMRKAGKERVSSDGKLNQSEFIGACRKGAFKN